MTAVVLISFAAADLCRRFGTYSVYVCSLLLACIIPWVNAFAVRRANLSATAELQPLPSSHRAARPVTIPAHSCA